MCEDQQEDLWVRGEIGRKWERYQAKKILDAIVGKMDLLKVTGYSISHQGNTKTFSIRRPLFRMISLFSG